MKKLINQIKNKVTFFNFFLMATLFGIIILLLSVGINYKYTKDTSRFFEQKQIEIEYEIQNLNLEKNDKNNSVIKNMEVPQKDFMKEYYEIQADWLNKWLTALAIIMAILGIMIPICFVKFLENKEKEMDRIIEDAKKQKEEMQLQVDEVNKKYDEISKNAKQVSIDLEKNKNYLNEVKEKSEQMSKELREVRAITKYNKAKDFMRDKRLDDAKELIKEAYELDSNNDEIIEEFAIHICYENNNFEEALNILNKAIKINPNSYTHYYYKAQSLSYLKRNKEAVPVMKTAIEKCKSNSQRAYCLSEFAIIYANLGKTAKYKNCANEAYRIWADENVVGRCACAATIILNYADMLKYYEALISFPNRNYSVDYYNLIEACIFLKQYDKTLNYLEKYMLMENQDDFIGIYNDDYEKWTKELNNAEQSDTIEKIKELVNRLDKVERNND